MSHQPTMHYLSDYAPPAFSIESVYLTFELLPSQTRVSNEMQLCRLESAHPLVLQGANLKLMAVWLDEVLLKEAVDYVVDDDCLTLLAPLPKAFRLRVETEIAPQENTRLEGLYRTQGTYCTQCEAEGFRHITYYLDRPDVLSCFTTKIIADKTDNAVLLSNGNLVEAGLLENNQHFAVWHDPFRKPCYLFALVAGNLAMVQDEYVTLDDRCVDLRIYVEPQNKDKCDHAMASLKKAMAWDESRFGLVYDLDIYMIVAVDDFNMGAMENKGLNVFNSKFVLSNPQTATDVDYEGIEAVIGHEYFHNWTGNRVTCRDWFQLTLKEGLTVFRDQEFTADMLSPAVKRIEDVKRLRNHQFVEDSGPMKHPIQPQSYIEMNNFYTMTVYEKGAEVVRLYHTLLGEAGFQKGMKLYFERHDGHAVTVHDFKNAMADANQFDLTQMQAWYTQAGTPVLRVVQQYDDNTKTLSVTLSQWLNGEQTHAPFLLPVKMGLISEAGKVLSWELKQPTNNFSIESDESAVWVLSDLTQTLEFQVLEAPILSVLRNFSAPVNLEQALNSHQLAILAQYDIDSFVRWESLQKLMMRELLNNCQAHQQGSPMVVTDQFLAAYQASLQHAQNDLALQSLSISLPDFSYVVNALTPNDVDASFQSYQFLKQVIADTFEQPLLAMYLSLQDEGDYVYEKSAIARRMLKNACLKYLVMTQPQRALAQYEAQQNMTDVWAALVALNDLPYPQRATIQADFYQRWHQDALVVDKWFALQASAQIENGLAHVKDLLAHPAFSWQNPNRVRSVLGVFSRVNLVGFHLATGEGYQLLADAVLKLDRINPQVAARMVAPFAQWQQQDVPRQALMRAQLERILQVNGLSKDVFEIVSKSLG